MGHDLFWTGDLLSLDSAVSLRDGKITSLYLRMMPEAKPIIPEKYYPVSTDTPAMEKVKAAYFLKSYAVFIDRDVTKVPANVRSTENTIRVSDVAGLERYVPLICYDLTKLKNIKGAEISYQRALSELSGKAKDDLSPTNCVSDRNLLFLQSSANTPFEKTIYVGCIVDLCSARFRFHNHTAQMSLATENPIYLFKKKNQALFRPFQQPLLDEIWTGLSQWQQRVDPTMQLLNSFVIHENQEKTNH